MANLDNIKALNLRYGKDSKISTKLTANINEGFDLKMRYERNNLIKAMSNSIATLGPTYTRYFDLGLPAKVALLFIDVCSFSSRYSGLSGEEISTFFDEYYNVVIPIIYKHGGEIDKIMGDGIICTFGPPFYDYALDICLRKANDCAKEIIEATADTKFISKVAFHAGEINYYKNKSGLYNEYTMIGRPLTELFRLESISDDQAINYFDESPVENHYGLAKAIQDFLDTCNIEPVEGEWRFKKNSISYLKGVDYKNHIVIKKHK